MISGTLLKREVKSGYKMILIFMGVLTMYASMIISMFDPKLGDSLNTMMESMPDLFAAFGMGSPGATLIDFLANYLYGFLFIVFPLIFIIILSNKLVAHYVDRGSMAYLLATPNKRRTIVMTQAFIMILSTFLLITYVTVLCIIVSQTMFSGELDIAKFLLLNIGMYGVYIFLGGMCFCSSCMFNESKYATGVGAGLAIAFVLIQMLSKVGDKFENLKYLTPLTLFDASGIITGNTTSIVMFCILYVVGILLFGIGIKVFCKRDLPI